MRRFILPLVPLIAGLVLVAVSRLHLLPNPIVYARADVGNVLLLLGLGISAVWVQIIALSERAERRCDQQVTRIRQEEADARYRFMRRLDHELKNPLTAIRAGLANLADQSDSTVLPSVRAQVDRLARLSAELRKLADLEAQPLEREAVDLGPVLAEVLELAEERPEAARRHLHLTLPQAPWPLPPVAGDRDLLFLAAYNLVDNALKFTTDGDTVEVRAFEDGATVVLEVADTGPGIPEVEMPHVWEELYRGQGARGVPGSGLGLALVQAIAERHGGRASLRSRAGQGTVFTMRLPVK